MKKNFLVLLAGLLLLGVSCEKKENPTPAPVPYATFTVNGVKKTYNAYTKFTKDFCSSSTFCGKFFYDNDDMEINLVKFGIPGDPVVGHIYKNGDYRFDVFYMNETGVRYELSTASFQVMFNVWEGQGGWGKGSFSGWLKSATNDSVELKNGYFQGMIWTMGTGK